MACRIQKVFFSVERQAEIWESTEYRRIRCPECETATVSRKSSSASSVSILFCPLCGFVYYREGDDLHLLEDLVMVARRES